MGVKRGYIVEEDTPATGGRVAIRRFRLGDGQRVYLPVDVGARLIARHSPAEEFVFLERGFLGRTWWAGTLSELRLALASGEVQAKDVGSVTLPRIEAVDGWSDMAEEDDHSFVGEKLGNLRQTVEGRGLLETAKTMSLESWLENAGVEGACLAERPDSSHGRVWCELDKGHTGLHAPVCPTCGLVKVIVDASARQAGAWR